MMRAGTENGRRNRLIAYARVHVLKRARAHTQKQCPAAKLPSEMDGQETLRARSQL
jgi:hypothetical protein